MMAPVDPKVSSTSPSTDSDTSPSRLERHLRRKITKHMVERKRRDRINHSLDQLRCLVLEALNKNPEQYSKMEKADILDMTVKYLKLMRARKGGSPGEGATFAVGYRACASEVARHLAATTLPDDMKSRLLTAISYKTAAAPPVVPCPTHVMGGYHGDYTSTPPGWRGVPTHYSPHGVVPPPAYPGPGTPLRVPPVHAQPRDLNMNIVDLASANPSHAAGQSTPLDNERYHPRRSATETVSTSAPRDATPSSSFPQPLQLNVSLNFGGQGRSPPAPGARDSDSDDMWRPW